MKYHKAHEYVARKRRSARKPTEKRRDKQRIRKRGTSEEASPRETVDQCGKS
jgi:hypothetical protein